MTDKRIAWLQVVGGFALLVFGVFLTTGIVEIGLAVLGVFIGAQGLQKLPQL